MAKQDLMSAQELGDLYRRAAAAGETTKALAALDCLLESYPMEIHRAIPGHDGAARGMLEAFVHRLARECDMRANCEPDKVFSALGMSNAPLFVHLHYKYRNRESYWVQISIVQARMQLPMDIIVTYGEPGEAHPPSLYYSIEDVDKAMAAALYFLKMVIAGTHRPDGGELAGKSYRVADPT